MSVLTDLNTIVDASYSPACINFGSCLIVDKKVLSAYYKSDGTNTWLCVREVDYANTTNPTLGTEYQLKNVTSITSLQSSDSVPLNVLKLSDTLFTIVGKKNIISTDTYYFMIPIVKSGDVYTAGTHTVESWRNEGVSARVIDATHIQIEFQSYTNSQFVMAHYEYYNNIWTYRGHTGFDTTSVFNMKKNETGSTGLTFNVTDLGDQYFWITYTSNANSRPYCNVVKRETNYAFTNISGPTQISTQTTAKNPRSKTTNKDSTIELYWQQSSGYGGSIYNRRYVKNVDHIPTSSDTERVVYPYTDNNFYEYFDATSLNENVDILKPYRRSIDTYDLSSHVKSNIITAPYGQDYISSLVLTTNWLVLTQYASYDFKSRSYGDFANIYNISIESEIALASEIYYWIKNRYAVDIDVSLSITPNIEVEFNNRYATEIDTSIGLSASIDVIFPHLYVVDILSNISILSTAQVIFRNHIEETFYRFDTPIVQNLSFNTPITTKIVSTTPITQRVSLLTPIDIGEGE